MPDVVTTPRLAQLAAAPALAAQTPAHAPARTPIAKKTARVVYFVASHVNPDQVVRLVKACRTGGEQSRVLVHHDYRVSNLDRKLVSSIDNVDLLDDTYPVEYGFFSMCLMVKHSLQWLLDHRDFDWVVYMTGQDYPVRPLAEIEQFLGETEYDGFVDCKTVQERSWVIGPQRYLYQYYDLPKFPGWKLVSDYIRRRQFHARARRRFPRFVIPQEKDRGFRIGMRPLHSPFNDRFRCYMGTLWWTLNRKSIEYMVRYADEHPKLCNYYRRIQYAPSESFFLTILCNNPELKLVRNDNKRFLQWSHPETGHPDILAVKDWDRIQASGAHFARKLDQRVDPVLLDMIDAHIGFNH